MSSKKISILYSSPSLLVLNKPSGLLTHPKNLKDKSATVVSWLLEHYPEVAVVGDQPTLRPGIVHRLDKDTSGLIVVARTQEAFEYLKKQFQTRQVKKTYLAVVYGDVKNKKGVIDLPLGKLGTRQSTRIHGKHELNEKSAITEYEVLERSDFPLAPSGYTLVAVHPLTGRTHQIRVHLKSIGYPIVGDPLYGGKQGRADYAKLGRFLLHAQKLAFISPSGQSLAFEVDPPEDFMLALSGDARLIETI